MEKGVKRRAKYGDRDGVHDLFPPKTHPLLAYNNAGASMAGVDRSNRRS